MQRSDYVKKRDYFAVGAILICSVFFGALFGHFLYGPAYTSVAQGNEYERSPPPQHVHASFTQEMPPAYTEEETPPIADSPGHKYVVTVVDGYIVVLDATQDSKTVQIATGISVASLPPEELERLSQGIYVYDEDALFRVLEDYGS